MKLLFLKKAKEEPCLIANPMVTSSFGLGFFAGAPIKTSDGFIIGSVSIIDRKSREFSEADQYLLESLATLVVDELEERWCYRGYLFIKTWIRM